MPLYTFNDNVQLNAPKHIDTRYINLFTPWASTAAVNAAIPGAYRYLGLTVLIGTVEYWYQAGIADIDLVAKGGGGGGIITADNGLTANVATNVQWGGTLIHSTSIDTAGFDLTISGVNSIQNISSSTGSGGSGSIEIGVDYAVISGINDALTSVGTVRASDSVVRLFQTNGVYEIHNMVAGTPGDDFLVWNPGTQTIGTQPSSILTITADNGLTMSTATNVQLGGDLLGSTTIVGHDFDFGISNDRTTLAGALAVSNNGAAGCGLLAAGPIGIISSGALTGVIAQAGSGGIGVDINTNDGGLPIQGTDSNSIDGSTIKSLVSLIRSTSIAPTNGIGQSIDFKITTTSLGDQLSNQIISQWDSVNDAARSSRFTIRGVKSGATVDKLYIAPNSIIVNATRFETSAGANVVAANNLTLGTDGNMFIITGNTQINAITTADWQASSEITLIFTGTPTLKHNTAGGGGTAPMLLAGSIDYTAAANDLITLKYDGTNWHEVSRKLSSGVGTYTFSNGLTQSPVGQVKLGGTLTGTTIIDTAGNNMRFTTTTFDGSGEQVPTFMFQTTRSSLSGSATSGIFRANQTTSNSGTSIALEAFFKASHTTGSIIEARAIQARVVNSDAGNVTTIHGIDVGITSISSGNVSSAMGIYVNGIGFAGSGSGTINNAYGIYVNINDALGGTILNSYGAYIVCQAGATGVFTTGGDTGVSSTGNNVGVNATGSISGVLAQSTGIPMWLNNTTTVPNTIVDGVLIQRAGVYTGASGVGSQIRFEARNDLPTQVTTGKIINRLTTVTNGAEVSEYEFVIVKAGALTTTMMLKGTGQAQLNQYGVGTFTGTPVYNLQVDSSGNIIEGSAPAGGIPSDVSQVHTAGATVTVSNGVNVLYVDPASVLANLTITFPATPHASNLLYVLFGGTLTAAAPVVTTLSVIGNAGQTLVEEVSPTTADAGNNIIYRWRSAISKWYRIN